MNISSKINDLLLVIEKLSKIITNETKHLKNNRRPSDIKIHQKEKITLSEYYEKEIVSLTKIPKHHFKSVKNEFNLLQNTINNFKKTLDDHNRALFAAKTVTERMIKSISQEVAKINNPPRGYSHYSKTQSSNKIIEKPVSIALNEVI